MRPLESEYRERNTQDTHQNQQIPFDDDVEIKEEDLIAIKNELMVREYWNE